MSGASPSGAIIHVGFAHTGTTSLQQNIFSKRSDIFYAGIPYSDLGGIFSNIKYHDHEHYDAPNTSRLCNELIFNKMRSVQRLVLSDETFVDQPAIYYTPAMMPIRVIAERLRAQFGRSTVLFTLRSQYSSVISNYLVLKNNYERLANRKIEPFDAWFAGNLTQVRNLFLRNLDPSHAIDVYRNVFGADAVQVLPLEFISQQGVKAYLDHLSRISGFEFSSAEIRGYVARNASPPHDIVLDDKQRAVIRRRSSAGNALVAKLFNLPLRDLGYPFPD